MLFNRFIEENSLEQINLGLSAIGHLRDCYNLYHSRTIQYGGITRKEVANDVCLSSIPKGEQPIALLFSIKMVTQLIANVIKNIGIG